MKKMVRCCRELGRELAGGGHEQVRNLFETELKGMLESVAWWSSQSCR